ncbi:pyridoxal-dependent decarboxylase domain-containing protein 1 [Aplochiton taeniatus]
MMLEPMLAKMSKNLDEAVKVLQDGPREGEASVEKRPYSRTTVPGPLQGDGQDVATIIHLVQNLLQDEDEKEEAGEDQPRSHWIGSLGSEAHVALLGHSLAAFISVLDRDRVRRLTTRILSDTMLWLCRLFRYENGSAYFHEDDREGLVKIGRMVLNARYEDYASEGYTVFKATQPVIYQSSTCRPGLGQHLCSQLGLPLSSLCTVPCNTMFGSQHQLDVALLEKLIKEDVETKKCPLLLIANAGTTGVGHTDKLARLKELCEQYNIWLHVEGTNLATMVLDQVSSSVMAATRSDSITLTLGPWLGLPAVPAVTLYKHEDPALSLTAGLTSSQPVEKLRALPLWLSLQHLGHEGIVEKIAHAVHLSHHLLEKLKNLAFIETLVEDELNSPVVVFRFCPKESKVSSSGLLEGFCGGEREVLDGFNRWLGERLAQRVPSSGVDVVELEEEGVCIRFTPLMTAAVLGTQQADVECLAVQLEELVPILSSTLALRQDFREEVYRQPTLQYMEVLTWPGLGAVRYEPRTMEINDSRRQQEIQKINKELLKRLKELDADLTFTTSQHFGVEDNCIFIGMVTDDIDVSELAETIACMGRDIEDSGRLLENVIEVVRKGIQEAEQQLEKDSMEKLMEEGVLRQIPLVGSMLNWFSPVQSSLKGRTFNLAAGSLDSTEPIYTMKAQTDRLASVDTSVSSTKRLPGQKLFRRSRMGTDECSDTISTGQAEELNKNSPPEQELPGSTAGSLEASQRSEVMVASEDRDAQGMGR